MAQWEVLGLLDWTAGLTQTAVKSARQKLKMHIQPITLLELLP